MMGPFGTAHIGSPSDDTTNHSWWQNDALLWDSLETGLQRELYPDEKARRTLDSEAALLERKVALSFRKDPSWARDSRWSSSMLQDGAQGRRWPALLNQPHLLVHFGRTLDAT
jgi:hypothetical protein